MTQEERSAFKDLIRHPLIIKGCNEALAKMAIAEEDPNKPCNEQMAANKYYHLAGAVAFANSLFRLGYSISEMGAVAPRVNVPQFKPEKAL